MKTTPDLIDLHHKITHRFYLWNDHLRTYSNRIQLPKSDIVDVSLLVQSLITVTTVKSVKRILVVGFSIQPYSSSKNYVPKCILSKILIIWR
jgi:hypothetical protein